MLVFCSVPPSSPLYLSHQSSSMARPTRKTTKRARYTEPKSDVDESSDDVEYAPKAKRPRTVRGKKGKLANLPKMPLDVIILVRICRHMSVATHVCLPVAMSRSSTSWSHWTSLTFLAQAKTSEGCSCTARMHTCGGRHVRTLKACHPVRKI